jgi:hypothetical protein
VDLLEGYENTSPPLFSLEEACLTGGKERIESTSGVPVPINQQQNNNIPSSLFSKCLSLILPNDTFLDEAQSCGLYPCYGTFCAPLDAKSLYEWYRRTSLNSSTSSSSKDNDSKDLNLHSTLSHIPDADDYVAPTYNNSSSKGYFRGFEKIKNH